MSSSSPQRKTRAVRRSGRLGVELPTQSPAPHLPPIHPSPAKYIPHAQRQQDEKHALLDAFRERLRTHKKLYDFQPMLRFLTIELGATDRRKSENAASNDDEEGEEGQNDVDDCFVFLKRVSKILDGKFPFAGQFVATLAGKIQDMVHERVHVEAIVAAAAPAGTASSPRTQASGDAAAALHAGNNSLAVDEDDDDGDGDSAASSDDLENESNDQTIASDTTRGIEAPKGNTFRNSLRCRTFPPTRVPKEEYIVTSCTYTPFDYSKKASDLSSIHLESGGVNKGKQWQVVQFPKLKPTVSRLETDALVQWAQSKLAAYCSQDTETSPATPRTTYAETEARFQRQLALYEHICYELSRLVFDKCPTTARFIHGLFVELVDTALRTVANADRDAEINDQRHKNVQLELQRLGVKLDTVKTSLASLEETLMKRQRHLLSERERIIRQRKKLNLLLCAVRACRRLLIQGIH